MVVTPRRKRNTAAAAVLLMLLGVSVATSGGAAVLYDKRITGREVVIVTPDRHSGVIPLVVALHGCDQSATEFLESSGLGALVDREGFVLALPQAQAGTDNPLGCWRWWEPENQRRTGDDPMHIVEITRSMDVGIDPRRVYALGFSSGGAMAMILGTVYPDVFAAIGVHSGVGFAAAANTACALEVMNQGASDPEARGELAYLHQAAHRIVPTIIIQGRDDAVVDPEHADSLVREIAQRNDFVDDGDGANDSFDAEPDAAFDDTGPCNAPDGGSCYPYHVDSFQDRAGAEMIKRILIHQLDHAWSGGMAGRRYTDPRGPDAAEILWEFFDKHTLDPGSLAQAPPRRCEDWLAPPWWHYTWAGTMNFTEYACDMNPWSMVWRHRIDGVSGPGRCP